MTGPNQTEFAEVMGMIIDITNEWIEAQKTLVKGLDKIIEKFNKENDG
jgi:hypothetical protein